MPFCGKYPSGLTISTARTVDSPGQVAQFWVVGMGKLGACELNVSSDIDLIYVYDDDAGNPRVMHRARAHFNHEYFARSFAQSTRWWATPPTMALYSASTWRCAQRKFRPAGGVAGCTGKFPCAGGANGSALPG